MRCNNHGTDLSSMIGVCASCLRERLCSIIILSNPNSNSNSNSNPIPTVNSNSNPYITHRKSINNQRFYKSPHIAITTGGCIGTSSTSNNFIRFPSVSNLFRSNKPRVRNVSDRGISPSELTESCKRTPVLRRGRPQKSVTEMIFCPLVTASPHISYAKSFSGNRSRKLVHFGRSDPNR